MGPQDLDSNPSKMGAAMSTNQEKREANQNKKRDEMKASKEKMKAIISTTQTEFVEDKRDEGILVSTDKWTQNLCDGQDTEIQGAKLDIHVMRILVRYKWRLEHYWQK
jgi:hypothetical protein